MEMFFYKLQFTFLKLFKIYKKKVLLPKFRRSSNSVFNFEKIFDEILKRLIFHYFIDRERLRTNSFAIM